ncbi:hypothetical protein [Streptomyces sp. NPDC058155]|uniref:hypothetical protein n=1 Tax=Streptomyces sp. NPDC058155 TaxID=3346359 RepID=UPI0036F0C0C6
MGGIAHNTPFANRVFDPGAVDDEVMEPHWRETRSYVAVRGGEIVTSISRNRFNEPTNG